MWKNCSVMGKSENKTVADFIIPPDTASLLNGSFYSRPKTGRGVRGQWTQTPYFTDQAAEAQKSSGVFQGGPELGVKTGNFPSFVTPTHLSVLITITSVEFCSWQSPHMHTWPFVLCIFCGYSENDYLLKWYVTFHWVVGCRLRRLPCFPLSNLLPVFSVISNTTVNIGHVTMCTFWACLLVP